MLSAFALALGISVFFRLSLGATTANRSAQANPLLPLKLTGNPFANRKLFAHDTWKENVLASAASIGDPIINARAIESAKAGTFLWLFVSSPPILDFVL
jgi:hypothetical protein